MSFIQRGLRFSRIPSTMIHFNWFLLTFTSTIVHLAQLVASPTPGVPVHPLEVGPVQALSSPTICMRLSPTVHTSVQLAPKMEYPVALPRDSTQSSHPLSYCRSLMFPFVGPINRDIQSSTEMEQNPLTISSATSTCFWCCLELFP